MPPTQDLTADSNPRSKAAQRAYDDEARISEFREMVYWVRTEAGLTQTPNSVPICSGGAIRVLRRLVGAGESLREDLNRHSGRPDQDHGGDDDHDSYNPLGSRLGADRLSGQVVEPFTVDLPRGSLTALEGCPKMVFSLWTLAAPRLIPAQSCEGLR